MIKVEKIGITTYKVNDIEISISDGNIPEDTKEFLLEDEIRCLEDFIKAEQERDIQSTIK